ncbi:hypothetical protein GCM10007385_41280 [Tateyamaria omphalii]|uniref:helix-turn-helix domain-containing protein n=1 Tax=Tateyamaria omphalii TaxID=299262 RepID=UPI00167B787C|nr:helix-turn-helix domain-containing protein [Tateyamaria omphalii]GGX67820.1 hypothetical protein GCM10007385_41280 [Tateyamaria omphalii]
MTRPKSSVIAAICTKIESDLSAPWRTATLAQHAAMAQHHFQRQFAAFTGETVAGYIRSRRLERAAIALQSSDARIIDVALDTGFHTHAALTRAFRAHFGCSPTDFKTHGLPPERQGFPARPYLKPVASRSLTVSWDLVDIPQQWLCFRTTEGVRDGRFFGDLTAVHRAFAELRDEIGTRSALLCTTFDQAPKGYVDPEATAYFGALTEHKFDLDWSEHWTMVEAGTYAVFPHYGPFSSLNLSWNRSVQAGYSQLGVEFRPARMFETYLSSERQVSDTELTALLYLPVKKSTVGKARCPEQA